MLQYMYTVVDRAGFVAQRVGASVYSRIQPQKSELAEVVRLSALHCDLQHFDHRSSGGCVRLSSFSVAEANSCPHALRTS